MWPKICAPSKRPFLTLCLVIFGFSFPSVLFAKATPEEVSKNLVEAFTKGVGLKTTQSTISEKVHVGFRTRTVRFAVGARTYRIVFSSDGTLSVSVLNEGDIAAQTVWTAKTDRVTVDEIVNFVYMRETGRKFDPASFAKTDDVKTDLERERIRKKGMARLGDGSALRWNQLMNQMLRGDTTGLATQGGGSGDLGRAVETGKAMDPCGSGGGAMSPQRAAITDVATAMAASMAVRRAAPGPDIGVDGVTDRSREYEKKGTYSLLKDLNEQKPDTSPQEVFRLIQDTGSNTPELFRKALTESDKTSKDPYSLAASRNFKRVIALVGEAKATALVGNVLKAITVDVTAFTDRRKLAPNAPVIYDRAAGQYFVDPTFASPSEARYLLSLATWYEAEMEQFRLLETLLEYQLLTKKISDMEHVTLSDSDERRFASEKSKVSAFVERLFDFARHLTKDPSYPR